MCAANLIALCANCHERFDQGKLDTASLRAYKKDPCILRRTQNPPAEAQAVLMQHVEMLIAEEVTPLRKRIQQLESALGAYTKRAGKVAVKSIKPANSSKVIVALPESAAKKLIDGFEQGDPLLRAFLDDIDLLDVRLLPDGITVPDEITNASAIPQEHAGDHSTSTSSDLTFITNEAGKSLRYRFGVLLGKDTRYFDCLGGYFFISGFYKLYPALENVEKVRILVGLQTDRVAYQLLQEAKEKGELPLYSHAEAKEQVTDDVLGELERSSDSPNIETGVHKFVEWLRSGKLEIKAHPTENLHAKVYIMTFVDGDRDKGRVITGSSNLTQSGLQDNLEFNVELKSRADYDFAIAKFNELWAVVVDVSKPYEDTIVNKSPYASFTPYELYLKFLYEYFRHELNRPAELEGIYVPTGFKKLKYQKEAVLNARKVLDKYGGVFLSDVVGLGKTYMTDSLPVQGA